MTLSVDHIIQHLHKVNARRQLAEQVGIIAQINALQEWQCKRLLTTHADLAAQDEYKLAMDFFVGELYGPKDFSQRDADIVRVIPKLAKVLPEKAMRALDDALALNAISFEMDMAMVQHMGDEPLTRDSYAIAYRNVGQADKRQAQLDIVARLGQQLADVVHIPGIGMLIKMARRPAKMAKLLALHEFLETGFKAFKNLGDVTAFIEPVITREAELNAQLLDPQRALPQDNPLPYV